MLERVISGGQTGADQAGWRAAKSAGTIAGAAALRDQGESETQARLRMLDMIDARSKGIDEDFKPTFQKCVARVVKALYEQGA
jgi:hypothetical protein